MQRKDEMTISELEKKSGVRRSTIHHYLQYGILHRPAKTGKTMAYYDQTHLQRLERIQKIKMDYLKTAKSSRIPLDLINHKLAVDFGFAKGEDSKKTYSKKAMSEGSRKKREAIIEATLKIYGDRGYYLTSIRELAREVGISAPTFYRHFRDKRELFVALIERVVRDLQDETRAALEKERDIALRSVIIFEMFYKHYVKIGEIINQLRAGVAVGDSWAKEQLRKLYNDLLSYTRSKIALGIKKGLVRDLDPQMICYFNFFLAEGGVHCASLDDKYHVKDTMKFIADILYNAFLTEEGKKVFALYSPVRHSDEDVASGNVKS